MNSFKRMLSALLIGGAGFGLFVACGGGEEDDCTLDGDCPEGQVCEAQVCVDTCETAADCADGEVCEPGVNTSANVCKAAGGTNNGTNNGSTNNGSTNNGSNNNLPTLYYIVEITDTSSGDEACSVSDPGSDLFGVALESTDGSVIAWGEFVNAEEGTVSGGEINEHFDASVISGAPASMKDCPEFGDDTVYSLGCGGSLWVEFKDDAGNPVALDATADQQVTVYEYGTQCGGSAVDEYSITICEDTEGARNGETGACTINVLQGGEGQASGNVSGF